MKRIKKKNAMWESLAKEHEKGLGEEYSDDGSGPFHLLLMGGDQVYADLVWDCVPALKKWLDLPLEERLVARYTSEMDKAVERFYFDLYRERWSQEDPKSQEDPTKVMGRIPSLMMWDDHDIFDGWGSYPDDQQRCEVYQGVYRRAREHFRLFQLQLGADEEAPPHVMDESGRHSTPEEGNLSYGHVLGGGVAIAVLDMRSERTRERVMSEEAWASLQRWMDAKAADCKHLLLMSSIPVVYLNSNMYEAALGLIPSQQNMEDDLRDQWVSRTHKVGRLRLIHRLLRFSKEEECRVTIVSGDVHVATLGYIESERDGRDGAEANAINQLVSSPIVNVSPAEWLVYLLEAIAGDKVEEVDRGITARLTRFPGSDRRLIAARNWLALTLDERDRIWAKWHIEDRDEPYTKVVHPAGTAIY